MKKITLLALAAAVAVQTGCDRLRRPPSPGLSVENGTFVLNGRPYRGVGVNYYDLFLRLRANPHDETTLQNLDRLARAGVPFVRFNAGGFSDKDWTRWKDDPTGHFVAMDRVVRAAESSGIGLIPSFFWTSQLTRTAGERKQAWGDPGSKTWALAREYLQEFVSRYRNSPAIWAWEFGNEWNLNADLPNAKDQRKPGEDQRDDLGSGHLSAAMQEFCKAVRALDPKRPLMTGNSHPRCAAWHNTNQRSWSADSFEQWTEILHRDNALPLDTVGIHIYADTDAPEVCGKWATGWDDYLRKLKQFSVETKRPLIVGEFGLADGGKFSPAQTRERYRDVLRAMGKAGVDLAALWVFDLPAQDGSWNVSFSNSRSYMIEDVIAANREWSNRNTHQP